MSTGAAPKEMLPFTPEQKQVVAKVASTALLVAGLLVLLGLLQIMGGPAAWWWGNATLINAVLTALQGLITAFLGLVTLAISTDFRYLGEYPRFGGNHLRNGAKNLTVFYQVQIVLALLLALVVVIRLAT
jgi:hypothetical protein